MTQQDVNLLTDLTSQLEIEKVITIVSVVFTSYQQTKLIKSLGSINKLTRNKINNDLPSQNVISDLHFLANKYGYDGFLKEIFIIYCRKLKGDKYKKDYLFGIYLALTTD